MSVGLGLGLVACLFRFSILRVFFRFSLDYFVLVLFALVLLGLVSSVLRQEIGWEERLRNDLFCVEWDGWRGGRCDDVTRSRDVAVQLRIG